MKIVAQNSARVWGGNEKSLATLATGLASRGHDVIFSCRRGAVYTRFEDLGFKVTPVRPRGEVDIISALRFARWLRRERPDALLLTSWVPTVLGAWAAHLAGVPRLIVRQGIVRDFPRSPVRRYAFKKWIDAVIVNSEEIRDRWLATAPASSEDRVHVILNGIESRRRDRDRLGRQLRDELHLTPQTILVGAAGHLFPRKGFDFLLRGFATAKVSESHLAILGDGDDMPSLRELAEELRIDERVHWLGRRASGAEIIAGYDAFVLSSRNEGMANVMLEAMAAGVPVIASNVSGVRTALGPTSGRPQAGWIISPDSTEELAAALGEVCDSLRAHTALVDHRIEEAHWRIENWFSNDRMVAQSESILFGDSSMMQATSR